MPRPKMRLTIREQAFLSWAGLRGAVPIVLATIPQAVGLPGTERVFDVVFVLVVIFTLIQGPILPWLARGLGVADDGATREISVDTAPLEEHHADLLTIDVEAECAMAGSQIKDLDLPQGALVTLLIRQHKGRIPAGDTQVLVGDQLVVVSTPDVRPQVELRLRALSRPEGAPEGQEPTQDGAPEARPEEPDAATPDRVAGADAPGGGEGPWVQSAQPAADEDPTGPRD